MNGELVSMEVYRDAYGERVALKYQYSPETNAVLKSNLPFPQFKWDADKRAWSVQNIQSVVTKMHEKHMRHMPVIGDEFVIGIVSDRDIRRACGQDHIEDAQAEAQGQVYFGATAVGEIMSTDLVTIGPEAKLTEAADMLHSHRISALPVVKDNRLAGIITDTDIIRLISKSS